MLLPMVTSFYSGLMSNPHFDIFLTFLRFGCLAWGGPVAQINMIREELVEKEGWISADKFKRVLAVYQALPGPEAHELCVYFGMVRKGRLGGFLAGLGFMLPGFLLILLLSWAYTKLGAAVLLPIFAGVAPAVAALIFRALHRIGQTMLTEISLWVAAIVAIVLTMLGVHFILTFIVCSVWQALWAKNKRQLALLALVLMSAGSIISLSILNGGEKFDAFQGGGLFIEGLKAGLLSFGGAYTALPFLKQSMVDVYPNVTMQTFLDGIALSSVIPAPLVIFGTYLGYLADGLMGAVLLTLGIFIPAFSFTLIGHEWLEKMIENPALHGALDGISAAVVGLLAITAIQIGLQTLTSIEATLIFTAAMTGLYTLRGKWVIPAIMMAAGLSHIIMVSLA